MALTGFLVRTAEMITKTYKSILLFIFEHRFSCIFHPAHGATYFFDQSLLCHPHSLSLASFAIAAAADRSILS
jgi:hypothetical protein